MSADDPATRLEGLLAHHAWVRKLARTLVRDDADADDLVQEAWLAALRKPPTEPGSARGWFGTVLRNASRQAHRGASRRERREDESARPEALPSSHEIVARAEEHRRVVDAVLGLEEPYRTTVLLRFFDELPPRDVAARMDVPIDTARTRIRRALERLRERLDAAHGGGGEAWKLALLPLAGVGPEWVMGTAAAKAAVTGTKAGAASTATPAMTSAMAAGALTMGTMATVTVGIVALAAGAAVVWLAGSGDRDALAKAITDAEAARAEVTAARSDAEKARADAKRKDEKIAELDSKRRAASQAQEDAEARASAAQSELSSLRDEVAKLKPGGDRALPPGQTFAFPEYADALASVNWKGVGEHMSALVPAIDELITAVRDGKPMPPKAIEATQKHNNPLVIAALQIAEKKLPGTGANGAFTHPAFMVNALAAALENIGKPLSAAQSTALEELGRRFSAEDRERLARYDDTTFTMQKLVEEGDLRGRFFAAARKVLSTEQVDALSPPAARDRLSVDLWSSGLFWSQFAAPVHFDTTDKLGADIAKRLTTQFKIAEGAGADRAGTIAVEWASRLPATLREREVDALEKTRWMRVDVVASSAAETRKLVERIASELNLDGESLTAAREFGYVFVPTPRDAPK